MYVGWLERVSLFINEVFWWRRLMIAVALSVISIALIVGAFWPKTYSSYATLIVDERKIFEPLLEGRAAATGAQSQAKVAREQVYSRQAISEVMFEGGWPVNKMSPIEVERLADMIKKRTEVSLIGDNLIKIEYQDSDPVRAQKIANKFALLLVTESTALKTEESQTAYSFIDKQVQEYHEKLKSSEQKMKEFRAENLEVGATQTAVSERIGRLQSDLDRSKLELREAQIQEQSIQQQLTGEAAVSGSMSREGQFHERIAELQRQLDTLRLSYQEDYPDIVRLKYQIQDMKQAIEAEVKRRQSGVPLRPGDESVASNPLYQDLRKQLADARTRVATFQARINQYESSLKSEMERGRRVNSGESVLAELTREYEANRDVYQDLLRRRENARVSRNLDSEGQGAKVRVYEEAFLPIKPTGLRFLHFASAGLALALMLPIALLIAIQELTATLRTPLAIEETTGFPVLAIVPQAYTPAEARKTRRGLILTASVSLSAVVIIAFAALSFKGLI